MEFEEQITDLNRLRKFRPFDDSKGPALKVSDRLNDVGRRFIEMSPFIMGAMTESGVLEV